MKVTLINPMISRKELRWDIEGSYPPLGLCYIASVLEEKGHKVNIIDAECLHLSGKELEAELKRQSPDIVGITSVTPKYERFVETIKVVEKIDREIPIVLGGPHATQVPIETMQSLSEVDFLVRDEGEHTMAELVHAIEKDIPFNEIKGLVYRKNGKIKCNERRPFIENLDELPFPARHLIPDLKRYKLPFRYKRLPVTTMITSRGCPFGCLFCDRIFGKKYRMHSADYVIEEIEHLIERYKIREIHFVDDMFLLDHKRTEEICKKIIDRGIDISWSCNGRINTMSKEHAKLIKKAGCWYVSFGIESGNQRILNFIRKGTTLSQIKKVVGWTHEAGIWTKGYFMIGHPTDDEESIRDTIEFAKSLPLDSVQFSITVPYPGTELYEIAPNYGHFEYQNYSKMSGHSNEPVFVPNGLTKDFLIEIQKKAYKEFYLRPSYILRNILKIRDLTSLKKYLERGLTYIKA